MPVAVLMVSVIAAISFFPFLPAVLAYSFIREAGDSFAGRGAVIAWTVVPQFALVLLASGIVWAASKYTSRLSADEKSAILGKAFNVMGNLMVLPQLLLAFAMLDIFVYNLFQTHLIPIWLFAVIVMALGGVYLGIFFVQVLRSVLEMNKEQR